MTRQASKPIEAYSLQANALARPPTKKIDITKKG